MQHNKWRLNVPHDESIMISPEARQIAFKQIYMGYTKRYQMKLLYAFLNYDPDKMTDYLIVYKVRNDDNTANLIMYDLAPIFSDRCTPNYRYYKQVKKAGQFFKYGLDEMTTLEESRFYEYIEKYLLLSRDKKEDTYWKDPKNAAILCEGLLDLSLRYKVKQ